MSPRKTVEGFIGGIAVAAVVVLASRALFPALPGTAAQVLVLCLLTGFVSHAGDLSESLLKRRAQVKDSSGVIPGQGGIMDKMDALLVTGPFFYYASRFWL